jgi:hypothetical protein
MQTTTTQLQGAGRDLAAAQQGSDRTALVQAGLAYSAALTAQHNTQAVSQ